MSLYVHINRGAPFSDPIVWTLEQAKEPSRVFVQCCCAWRPVMETWYRERFEEWYGYSMLIECAPGYGCDVDPSRANGALLREPM